MVLVSGKYHYMVLVSGKYHDMVLVSGKFGFTCTLGGPISGQFSKSNVAFLIFNKIVMKKVCVVKRTISYRNRKTFLIII